VTLATVHAQVGRGTTEWLTAGSDAQRTFWVRADPLISVASMSKPGFELQWSAKLDSPSRPGNGLQPGVTANGVTLFVPMSVVAGSANTVYALDNDTGHLVWQRTFDAPLPAPTTQCPGGITAGPTRIVPLTPPPITPALAGITGGGRAAQGYRSVIGEPGEGAPVQTRGGGPGRGARGPAAPERPQGPEAGARGAETARGAAPPPQRGGGAAPPDFGIPGATAGQLGNGRGLARPSGVVYVLAGDGVLHVMGLPSGKDIQKPAEFIPANARWTDTIAVGTTLYATSSGNCGGAPNAVWAIDLESDGKPVTSWKSNGGPIVGRIAFGSDGTLFAAVGAGTATGNGKANAIVALDPKTLQLKDWFSQPTATFTTGPTVFTDGNREIVAAATKDGRILLFDGASLGGADHATSLHASSPVAGGIASDALATWQELTFTAPASAAPAGPPAGFGGGPGAPLGITAGARWIVAPTASGIASFKVTASGGTISLAQGWTAAGLTAPSTPIVVNGVVFALSTGRPSSPAAVKAYEGTTGKLLWDSKGAMKAPAAPGSFWSAMSQIYVGAADGTLYTFGFTDERR
jgi:outer membrane protein assembly factor BamB